MDVVVQGIPACRGIVRGHIVKVTDSLADLGRLAPDSVIVAQTASLALMPLLAAGAALVAERGGVLSRVASYARAIGRPTIVGSDQAFSRLRDGEEVLVDATTGIVYRLISGEVAVGPSTASRVSSSGTTSASSRR